MSLHQETAANLSSSCAPYLDRGDPEGERVTAGMFPVNQHLTVVLFDSGSSHSFMSQAFAQKHDQPVTELGYGYRISSAGADVLTNKTVTGVTLDIGGRRFRVNLVVMPGLVLDVIIGMC